MPVIRLSVVHPGDPPPWDDLERYEHVPDAAWRVAVLADGMESGAPSVAVRIDPPGGGTPVVFETSLEAWIAATSGMRGAFPEVFAGGPLAAP